MFPSVLRRPSDFVCQIARPPGALFCSGLLRFAKRPFSFRKQQRVQNPKFSPIRNQSARGHGGRLLSIIIPLLFHSFRCCARITRTSSKKDTSLKRQRRPAFSFAGPIFRNLPCDARACLAAGQRLIVRAANVLPLAASIF